MYRTIVCTSVTIIVSFKRKVVFFMPTTENDIVAERQIWIFNIKYLIFKAFVGEILRDFKEVQTNKSENYASTWAKNK